MTQVAQILPAKTGLDPYATGKLDGRATIAFNNIPALMCGSLYLLLKDWSTTSATTRMTINTIFILVLSWTAYLSYYLYTSHTTGIIHARASRAITHWKAGRRTEVRREIVELMNGQWGPMKLTLRLWIVVGMTIWFGRAREA